MSDARACCLVLPHLAAEGPLNMARDESLLERVAEGGDADAAFRTYGWTEPTLSLGYFQPFAAVEDDPRWRGVAVVRRPTGGGAILHHHEVTYALAISRRHPLARQTGDLYRAVHAALAALVARRGLDAVRRGDTDGGDSKSRPFLCFADRDPEDVVVGGVKVIGSAQRRRAGAVLQHGSVLLARSPLAVELAGLADLSHVALDEIGFGAVVRAEVPAALGFTIVPTAWDARASARVEAIARDAYRDRSWTARR